MKNIFIAAGLVCSTCALAAIFSNIRGIVHDPDHRPVSGAHVTIRSASSEWTHTELTNSDGQFEFSAVPVGNYKIGITSAGFLPVEESVTVTSDSARVLHFPLKLAPAGAEAVTVSEQAAAVDSGSSTPTTLIGRSDIDRTPGAGLTNSLAEITSFVPGAYMTHDQLHLRGGHQVTWAVDGVPVPNTNIASNVGPQFDPKDADYIEVLRGGYGADYGDRTYGVFNVVPRTGFERNNEAEVRITAGSFHQTNDQISFGSHTQRFAYYASLNGNRSDYGLSTPVADTIHDQNSGFGGFSTLIFNPDALNQFRLIMSARSDFYQIPNDPDGQAAGIRDVEHETDGFVNFSWLRTLRPGVLLTISPFFHYNSARYQGGPNDVPPSANDERTSTTPAARRRSRWLRASTTRARDFMPSAKATTRPCASTRTMGAVFVSTDAASRRSIGSALPRRPIPRALVAHCERRREIHTFRRCAFGKCSQSAIWAWRYACRR